MRIATLALAALLFVPHQGAAQSLSLEELQKQIDARVNTVSPYAQLLNDPDPTRSLAAMEIMIESGDPKLRRSAIEYGLYSPNPVVQRIALKGYFDTLPAVNVQFTGEQAAKEPRFGEFVRGSLDGSVNAENGGSFTISLDQYDPENRCYVGRFQNSSMGQGCVLVLVDQGISIRVNESHGAFRLTDSGELVGSMSIRGVQNPVSARIGIGF